MSKFMTFDRTRPHASMLVFMAYVIISLTRSLSVCVYWCW